MSDAEVTREGLEGVIPGRQARSWSTGGDRTDRGADRPRPRDDQVWRERSDRTGRPTAHSAQHGRDDHPGGSYYGRPIINPPVWAEFEIAGYLFAGGLAGASSLLGAGADLTARPRLARRAKLCATAAISFSLAALVHDLGRPARFLHMLRVFKPTSPMSVGVWILFAYGPLAAASAASSALGVAPRAGRAAGLGAAALAPAVASYTAALISDTAVPAWHEGYREMPFLFAGSAASAGAGFGLIAAPRAENGPAQRMAVVGAVGELVAGQRLERRLGPVAQTLRTGSAGRRLRAAKALTAGGALGAATLAHRHRAGAALSGGALLAGSALTRFGVFAAGMESAQDPKYTVDLQRVRLREPL